MLWSTFAVVRHADALAIILGEPYETLILTLAVISIEVMMISAVMLTGSSNPGLARDTMYAVLMIVLNGMVGITLLIGAHRHYEQEYNLEGTKAFLAVLVPISFLGLLLPTYSESTSDASLTTGQQVFFIVLVVALYGVFLAIQTVRHRPYFMAPGDDSVGDDHHHDIETRSIPFHAVLLVAYMVPIVVLSKMIAKPIDFTITQLGAPAALGGFIVAALVLTPEVIAAIGAARADNLQRSVNILLGSAVATIGLTIPAVLAISFFTGLPVLLGLSPKHGLMLVLTLFLSFMTFSGRRTSVLQGAVHLVVFAAYIMLIFD
jgi:Ca2+:H+ antiporter